jgi:REP element-mobilizing transposase RayT
MPRSQEVTVTYNPAQHHPRSIRLQGYDYSQAGAYFVTICTQEHTLFFENDAIREIAEQCWSEIPDHFPAVELDEWIVMPNHVHGIIVICDDARRGVQLNAPTPNAPTMNAPTIRNPDDVFSVISPHRNTLSVIVRTYKAAVTTLCRRAGRDDFAWQRNYHEHIIRNEGELNRIRQYIADNPIRWETDMHNPDRRQ